MIKFKFKAYINHDLRMMAILCRTLNYYKQVLIFEFTSFSSSIY